jgi:LysM repeat protein
MRLQRRETGKNGRNLRPAPPPDQASGVADVCPRLGMLGDPLTSYGYPHPANACGAVQPPAPVRLEHQASACLSGKYKTCSLYHFYSRLGSARKTLPAEVINRALVLKRPRPLRQRPILAVLVAVLVIGTIYTFFNVWMPSMALDLGGFEKASPTQGPVPSLAALMPLAPQTQALFSPAALPTTTPVQPPAPSPTALPSTTPLDIVGLLETQPSNTPESPSPTRTPISKATPTSTSSQCVPRTGWQVYTVQPGDTLYRLSQILGISVAEIREANCLESGNIIDVGQTLYLPSLPILPPARPTHTPPIREATPISAATPTNPPPPTATSPPPTPLPSPPPSTDTPPPPTNTSPPPISAATPTPRSTPTLAPTESGS